MTHSISLIAPAKLNLNLSVKEKLKNGYHSLESNICFLDLHDEINIEISNLNSIEISDKSTFTLKDESILLKTLKCFNSEFKNKNHFDKKKFVVAGGVAANKKIREMLVELCKEENYESIFPPIEFCGDNAAMIAMVGLEKYKLKRFDKLDHPAKPRWSLDEKAVFLKGAGVRL